MYPTVITKPLLHGVLLIMENAVLLRWVSRYVDEYQFNWQK